MGNILQKLFRIKSSHRSTDKEINPIEYSLNRQSTGEVIEVGNSTEVSELLKQATELKNVDIEKSIQLIERAIKIKPEYSIYYKLTSYLISAHKYDEAEKVFKHLFDECRGNNTLFNFSNRSANYGRYSDFLFKKGKYNEYMFYYCLSIYNSIAWDALSEDIESVRAQLKFLKNKEEFVDKKTNKSFQEIGAAPNQNLFIETFHMVLKQFDFEKLYTLVDYLNNKQKNREKLELESINNQKEDWKLWSNNEFRETILKYDESLFIEKYKSKLEILLEQKI